MLVRHIITKEEIPEPVLENVYHEKLSEAKMWREVADTLELENRQAEAEEFYGRDEVERRNAGVDPAAELEKTIVISNEQTIDIGPAEVVPEGFDEEASELLAVSTDEQLELIIQMADELWVESAESEAETIIGAEIISEMFNEEIETTEFEVEDSLWAEQIVTVEIVELDDLIIELEASLEVEAESIDSETEYVADDIFATEVIEILKSLDGSNVEAAQITLGEILAAAQEVNDWLEFDGETELVQTQLELAEAELEKMCEEFLQSIGKPYTKTELKQFVERMMLISKARQVKVETVEITDFSREGTHEFKPEDEARMQRSLMQRMAQAEQEPLYNALGEFAVGQS